MPSHFHVNQRNIFCITVLVTAQMWNRVWKFVVKQKHLDLRSTFKIIFKAVKPLFYYSSFSTGDQFWASKCRQASIDGSEDVGRSAERWRDDVTGNWTDNHLTKQIPISKNILLLLLLGLKHFNRLGWSSLVRKMLRRKLTRFLPDWDILMSRLFSGPQTKF